MEDKVKRIMSDVLNVDIELINGNFSSENVENWDSLKHMNLIVALEEEFSMEFNDEEMIAAASYNEILDILSR